MSAADVDAVKNACGVDEDRARFYLEAAAGSVEVQPLPPLIAIPSSLSVASVKEFTSTSLHFLIPLCDSPLIPPPSLTLTSDLMPAWRLLGLLGSPVVWHALFVSNDQPIAAIYWLVCAGVGVGAQGIVLRVCWRARGGLVLTVVPSC
jgi:hypothetical protein